MQRREYEMQASRYWGQNVTKSERPARSKGRKLTLALGRWYDRGLAGSTAAFLVSFRPPARVDWG
jgi:hypothetical protein